MSDTPDAAAGGITFGTPAWLLKDIANTPGVLRLDRGWLSFTSNKGVVFDEPLTAVTDVKFPWYYFSGGFKATVADTRRRISLTRPNNAAQPDGSLSGLIDLGTASGVLGDTAGALGDGVDALSSAATSLGDVATGRRFGRIWRSLLTAPASEGA